MKITFDELVADIRGENSDMKGKRNWLFACIMSSLTNEAIKSGEDTRSYEVKLLVNGIELEPRLLQDLIENIEKYVDREAEILADRKFSAAIRDVDDLADIVREATEKIRDRYDIQKENED
jgi:hypothetical protein